MNDLRPEVAHGVVEEPSRGVPSPRPGALAVSLPIAAELIGCGDTWLKENYVSAGIPYARLGKRVVFPLKALERWLDDRTMVGAA